MIRFGKIVNVHGLRGDVKILTNSDFAEERLKAGKQLLLTNGDRLTVEKARLSKTTWLVKFKELSQIEQAEVLKNEMLFVEGVEILEEDEFYHADLIGLTLVANGKEVGNVVDVREVGSGHNLVCQGNERFQIPFVNTFVGDVDFEKKTIEIFPIPGMLPE